MYIRRRTGNKIHSMFSGQKSELTLTCAVRRYEKIFLLQKNTHQLSKQHPPPNQNPGELPQVILRARRSDMEWCGARSPLLRGGRVEKLLIHSKCWVSDTALPCAHKTGLWQTAPIIDQLSGVLFSSLSSSSSLSFSLSPVPFFSPLVSLVEDRGLSNTRLSKVGRLMGYHGADVGSTFQLCIYSMVSIILFIVSYRVEITCGWVGYMRNTFYSYKLRSGVFSAVKKHWCPALMLYGSFLLASGNLQYICSRQTQVLLFEPLGLFF